MKSDFELVKEEKILKKQDKVINFKKFIRNIKIKIYELATDREKYDIRTLIILFFIFSFVSWLWEVILYFFQTGEIVNKGILIGPILPIYGFGGIFIILLFSNFKIKKRYLLTFCAISIVCTVLEFFTSIYLEKMYGMRWWDYSDYFWNLNGRISFLASLFFGIIGSIGLYIIAPFLKEKIKKISKKIQVISCLFLIILILIDFGYSFKHPNSGKGITFILNDEFKFVITQ